MKNISLVIALALGLHVSAFASCRDEFGKLLFGGDYTQAFKECAPQAEHGVDREAI